MTKDQLQSEALARARGSVSTLNFMPIIMGFTEKGIAQDDIIPRVNVLTFHAWKAVGRSVKKGEHGVKIVTWIPVSKKRVDTDGNEKVDSWKRPKTATVFHISQTQAL